MKDEGRKPMPNPIMMATCNFCNDENNCIVIRRKDQLDKILARHKNGLYVCGQCLIELKSRDAARQDPSWVIPPISHKL